MEQKLKSTLESDDSKINMNQWADNLKKQKKRAVIPIMTHPGIEFIGKKVIDAVSDGTIHYQAIKALANRYPASAATMIMDLTVEAEAFGCKITFHEDEVPAVSERLISDDDTVKNLEIPSLDVARIPQYLIAARLAAKNIVDRPVFGGCIGPFSLAGRLFDMTEIMTALFLEPETILLLLEKCTRFLISYAQAIKDTGVGGVIVAEPAAGLLDGAMCDQFSSVFVKQIVDAVQDDHFLVVLHNCGDRGHVTKSMVSTGAGALHFGNQINMVQALKKVPDDIIVMGNLDPVRAFKMAKADELSRLTDQLLEDTKDFPNFVLSSGCDIPPGVPEKNIAAFFESVYKYNLNK